MHYPTVNSGDRSTPGLELVAASRVEKLDHFSCDPNENNNNKTYEGGCQFLLQWYNSVTSASTENITEYIITVISVTSCTISIFIGLMLHTFVEPSQVVGFNCSSAFSLQKTLALINE